MRTVRASGSADDAAGSAAASYVLHSSPAVCTCSGACRDSTAATWRRCRSTGARAGHRSRPRRRARRRRAAGFHNHKRERPSPVTIEYLRPRAVLDAGDFPRVVDRASDVHRAASRHRGATSPIAWRARSVFCRPSSRRSPASTATCTRFGSAVGWYGDSHCQTTRHWPCSPSGTRGVSRHGPSGAAGESSNARRYGREPLGASRKNERDSCVSLYIMLEYVCFVY